jgi:hypothetical protein
MEVGLLLYIGDCVVFCVLTDYCTRKLDGVDGAEVQWCNKMWREADAALFLFRPSAGNGDTTSNPFHPFHTPPSHQSRLYESVKYN